MLQTVAIRGYRSLREVILPLGRLSVITGANGAGKSSLYRALRLLADCGRSEVIASLAREGGLQSVLWAGPEQLGAACRTGKAEGTGDPVSQNCPTGNIAYRAIFQYVRRYDRTARAQEGRHQACAQ